MKDDKVYLLSIFESIESIEKLKTGACHLTC